MGKPIDLTGKRFGKLTVIEAVLSPAGYEHQRFWLVRCDCGAEMRQKTGQLNYAFKRGVNQACASCAVTTHGMTGTSEHKIWIQMRDRCRRPSHHAWKDYGGRGITVCDRWGSFENFLADMGPRPSTKHSLDRINCNLGYSPENCRWTTMKTQNRNKQGNALLTHNGKTQCLSAWAEETGLSIQVIRARIQNHGWTVEQALTTPAGHTCNWRRAAHKDAAKFEYNGQCKTLREWAASLAVPESLLRSRIARKLSPDRVFVSARHRRT